jgi:hypothetical protein
VPENGHFAAPAPVLAPTEPLRRAAVGAIMSWT